MSDIIDEALALVRAHKAEKEARRQGMTDTLLALSFEDGCVIEWKRTFERSGIEATYTYVAVKVSGYWFISGQERQAFAWEALVHSHLQYAESVWLLTAAEQLA